jgi:y4mF family transcriptional regulator
VVKTTPSGINSEATVKLIPIGYIMNKENGQFGVFFKEIRKENNLTQEDLARKAGVGLRFVRDVEQGKGTIRLDRVNAVLALFGYVAGPVRGSRDEK